MSLLDRADELLSQQVCVDLGHRRTIRKTPPLTATLQSSGEAAARSSFFRRRRRTRRFASQARRDPCCDVPARVSDSVLHVVVSEHPPLHLRDARPACWRSISWVIMSSPPSSRSKLGNNQRPPLESPVLGVSVCSLADRQPRGTTVSSALIHEEIS